MEQEDIEVQLWEYIDGICNDADKQRISSLITTDEAWKEKFYQLTALQDGIAACLEAEQPSMRFTKNVMDTVNTVHISTATKQYINPGIIRGIAAFFIVAIISVLGYAIANTGTGERLPKANLSSIFSSGFFNLMVGINIVLALAFADILLRKRRLNGLD